MKHQFKKIGWAAAVLAVVSGLTPSGLATSFTFNTDPFAGTTALTTPGRQVVAGESFISFSPATDTFVFDPSVFGVASPLTFANVPISSLPTTGANVVVLETFDNDANTATPFGAGQAADLIAAQVTVPGPGFFIYFNSGLDRPRLVYSKDLNDNTADLKILARLLNLTGQIGRDTLPTFTPANFTLTTDSSGGGSGSGASTVPDTSSNIALAVVAVALFGCWERLRRAPSDC